MCAPFVCVCEKFSGGKGMRSTHVAGQWRVANHEVTLPRKPRGQQRPQAGREGERADPEGERLKWNQHQIAVPQK